MLIYITSFDELILTELKVFYWSSNFPDFLQYLLLHSNSSFTSSIYHIRALYIYTKLSPHQENEALSPRYVTVLRCHVPLYDDIDYFSNLLFEFPSYRHLYLHKLNFHKKEAIFVSFFLILIKDEINRYFYQQNVR